MDIKTTLLSRVRPGTRLALMEKAFDLSDRLAVEKAKITRNPHLTEEGKRDAIAKAAATMLPEMNRVNSLAFLDDRQAKFDRKNLTKGPEIDRAQPTSLFDEAQRGELRSYIRSLPPAERIQAAFEMAKTQIGAEAVLNSPSPALIGIPETTMDQLKSAYSQSINGDKLKALDAVDEDISALNGSVKHVGREFQEALGYSDEEFASAIALETRY